MPDPTPLAAVSGQWARWTTGLISLALLVVVVHEAVGLDIREIWRLVPSSPSFWLVFFAYYCATPATEWIIYRRLWGLPPSGILPLLRKRIANEIVLGYAGDLYFYAWARRRAHIVGAPFGAVKDVAILSALAGNVITLIIVALAWPLFSWSAVGPHAAIGSSVAILVVTMLMPLLLRRQLFSLPRTELRFVLCAQTLRVITTAGLAGLMWHLALPQVALSWWLLLAAASQLLSRLPLFPNKDFIFAAVAMLLVGHDAEIARLMAMIAGLLLATHLAVGALLLLFGFAKEESLA